MDDEVARIGRATANKILKQICGTQTNFDTKITCPFCRAGSRRCKRPKTSVRYHTIVIHCWDKEHKGKQTPKKSKIKGLPLKKYFGGNT